MTPPSPTSDIPTVTVLMGGPDAERAVSLESGSRVAEALATFDDLRVVPRRIDRPDLATLEAMLDADVADVVFPVLHGPWGEGGPLQALLETTGRRFVGTGSNAAATAMDKLAAKSAATAAGLPTPSAVAVRPGEPIDLATPFVVKPVDEGSSVGVRFVHDPADAEAAVESLRSAHPRLMAESFIRGRELTVAVLDDRALPIIEIIPATGFYDYDAKYERDDTRYEVAPSLPEGVAETISGWSVDLHRAMGLRHLSRVDWLLAPGDDDGTPARPWFLEVNTMPGMTGHSLVPMAAAATGLGFAALCRHLVETALADQRGEALR